MVLLFLGCVPAPETGKVDPVETGDSDSACVVARWYPDLDGDGYGDDAGVVEACSPPEGWIDRGGDCDDTDETVNPAAVDPCGDGIDWDCDGGDPECPWAGVVDLGTMAKLTGTEPGEDAGRLFDVADVTDDGVPDLFVATFGADAYGGGGYLVPGPITASGSLGDLGFAFSGDAATTYGAGRAIGLGDVDGDGVGDVAIGVPYLENALYVFRGPITGDRLVEEPDLVLRGPRGTYAAHGADLGDLDGDGIADAVVGAYLNPEPVAGAGTGYIKYGPLTEDLDLTVDADVVIAGVEEYAYTGRHVAMGGDVNGDGLEDVLIAAPNATGGAPTSGVIYLVYGPGQDGDVNDADGRLLGETPGSSLGIRVAMAMGDLDGDGLDDVAAGAYYDGGTIGYGGAAYVVRGPAAGEHDLGGADVVVRGDSVNQYAGSAVAIGDADRDGVGDLVVGAEGTETSTGAAFVYSGVVAGSYGPTDADAALLGEDIIQFAGSFTCFGDVDGDAVDELMVGAIGEWTGGSEAGAVYVVRPSAGARGP